MNLTDVIKGPIVTEKLDQAREDNHQYAFLVDREANKSLIADAVEKLFKVNVVAVRTSIHRGKVKRIGRSIGQRPNWKRAVVTLKEGQTIDLFETA
ncbi:MAG: 50S ribosomal protein L23 [Deltaproteobacteria bacterium]|nr:50S ribosomal protein L23 [Deltaproteobacteria bacterium]